MPSPPRRHTLRSYAMHLLHFLRWWESVHHTDDDHAKTRSPNPRCWIMCASNPASNPRLSGSTINRALPSLIAPCVTVPRCAQPGRTGLSVTSIGGVRRWALAVRMPALSRVRVKTPKRTIVPLSVDEVARFWSSFRTSRDLAIVGLMLLQGLRSKEVMALNRDDLLLSEAQIRVRGKGNKIRFLPLAPEASSVTGSLSAPGTAPDPCGAALFVSLKGPARGSAHDTGGTAFPVPLSSPDHRRHARQPTPFQTYLCLGMVRAGVSLPALMQLMGHAHIQTTLVYVQVTPPTSTSSMPAPWPSTSDRFR